MCQVWTDMETWGFCLLCSVFSEAIKKCLCGRFCTAVRSLFILSLLALGSFRTLFGGESGLVMFWGNKEGIALDFWLGFLFVLFDFAAVCCWSEFLEFAFSAITPTTFRLTMASDIPAMFCALHRYSPASLYDIPFRLIAVQRIPTCGDSCTSAGSEAIMWSDIKSHDWR